MKPNTEQENLIKKAALIADQRLDGWLAINAPQSIRDLYSQKITLTIFEVAGDYSKYGYTPEGLTAASETARAVIDQTAAELV